MSANEVLRNIAVDDRLDSYKSFHDEAWITRLADQLDSTALESAGHDLAISWRCAAESARLPWLMMLLLKEFANGLAQNQNDERVRMLRVFAGRVMQECDLHDGAEKLQQLVSEVSLSIGFNRPGVGMLDAEKMFRDLVRLRGNAGLSLALMSSQRLAYSALYFGYEDFVKACCRAVSGDLHLRFQPKGENSMDAVVAREFGENTSAYCCKDTNVVTAKLIRHSIVHEGCRLTRSLRGRKVDVVLEEGQLYIMPEHTKRLLKLLQPRADRLATESLARFRANDGAK